ncbi:hypothetical protein WDU94_010136 [Cyamophila willieti]
MKFTLQIRYLQPRDSGYYECQVSTEPKMSRIVNLKVIVPNVTIVPGPEMIVKSGSLINITCYMTPSILTPDFIFWFHNGSRVIDYNNPDILTITQVSENASMISILTIQNAREDHAGNYTCKPSNLNATMTYLHVISGKTSIQYA